MVSKSENYFQKVKTKGLLSRFTNLGLSLTFKWYLGDQSIKMFLFIGIPYPCSPPPSLFLPKNSLGVSWMILTTVKPYRNTYFFILKVKQNLGFGNMQTRNKITLHLRQRLCKSFPLLWISTLDPLLPKCDYGERTGSVKVNQILCLPDS